MLVSGAWRTGSCGHSSSSSQTDSVRLSRSFYPARGDRWLDLPSQDVLESVSTLDPTIS